MLQWTQLRRVRKVVRRLRGTAKENGRRDDGVTDALFKFTVPVTGSYFWCPPMAGNRLDLGALAL